MFLRIIRKCFQSSTLPAFTKDVLLKTKHNHIPWNRYASNDLKGVIKEVLRAKREEVAELRKAHDEDKMGDVKVSNLFGGMRGLKVLVYEPSLLDAETGITFRGYTIPEVREQLPKGCNAQEPLPEGLFWLLCTGCIPTDDQVKWVTNAWNERSEVPEHIYDMLLNFPTKLHPMSKLSAAITALSMDSNLSKALECKIKPAKLWEPMYEDVMNLLAKITNVAAVVYTTSFKDCVIRPEISKDKDWTENYCLNMGYKDKSFIDFMRLYLILHSDHEGGNVSAHATHLTHSALPDAYLSLAAGINGLAGPLHGLANQEVIRFILELQKEVGDTPTDDQVKAFCEKKLQTGVIPGYGHAVLRQTDPRYTSFKEFAEKNIKDDKMTNIVWQLFKIVPPLLQSGGKVKNPWPNVDAHSGCILQHYGMKEMNYYTVLFAVSRALGVLSWLIWARGLNLPLERPRSLTTSAIMDIVTDKKKDSSA